MASPLPESYRGEATERAPRGFVMAAAATVALVVAGALYLVAVRGDALFLDLAGLSGLLFCF